ncbi:hypothetical protein B0F90DRAFT_179488 [Multifurca ochricompacta]|uniref:Uncharacterized protein n=1 Tax=Multifurca ochricompacta TaxID=376703 RepID=A0AAD4QPD8_9AGAM|nr:hypothetical protein B0F90DRAFT_179488 [Multifurca ochricompacta]
MNSLGLLIFPTCILLLTVVTSLVHYYQYIVTTVVNMSEGGNHHVQNLLVEGKQERQCVIEKEWRGEQSTCVGEESSQGHLAKGGHVKAHMSWIKVRKSSM